MQKSVAPLGGHAAGDPPVDFLLVLMIFAAIGTYVPAHAFNYATVGLYYAAFVFWVGDGGVADIEPANNPAVNNNLSFSRGVNSISGTPLLNCPVQNINA